MHKLAQKTENDTYARCESLEHWSIERGASCRDVTDGPRMLNGAWREGIGA